MTAAFAGAPNPGDTGNESLNSYNKRIDVPVTEQLYLDDRPDLPGPDQDASDGITGNDRPPRIPGDPDNKAVQLIEMGWTPDLIIPAEPYDDDDEEEPPNHGQ